MKALRFSLALAVGLFAASALAQKVELNTISAVKVSGGTIEITGTKKPNFTTFTMSDPPRLVIDISEAVFSGVSEEQQIGNGTVTAVKTASYGSDESAIARVLIGFEREVETDIQSSGNKLVVKVLGAGGAPVAQAPAEEKPKAEQPAQGGEQVAQGTTITPADRPDPKAVREAEQRAEEERKQQQEAAREAEKRAEDERIAQQKAADEANARAEQERRETAKAEQERADREAQAKAEADEKAKSEEAAKSDAEQKRLAAQQEKQRQADEAKAKAEQERTDREAQKTAAAEEKRQKAEEEKQAREDRKRQAEEERQAALEEKKRAREEKIAAAEKPAARAEAEPSSSGGLSVSSRRKTISLVGFSQQANVSRVYVRTNEPVAYTVRNAGEKTLVVELENTRIGNPNNSRFLDTSYFDTNVAMVDPSVAENRTVQIQIKLKESVPYEAKQEGNELVLEFPRPSHR